ncbi:MAG TPA: carboxypeptidase-like regulatory domain-containing protein, partial [Vicinamibacteria bacterium]
QLMPDLLPGLRRLIVLLALGGLCPGLAHSAAGAELARVEISFSIKVASSSPAKGAILLRPLEGEGEPIRLGVTSWDALSLLLPPGTKWEASGELPDFWIPRKVVAVEEPARPTKLTLDVWPLGKIAGTVKVKDKDVPLPKKVAVKTLAVPAFLNRPAVPKGAMDCPVDEKGAWTCSLPAATFDLVISAQGLTPQYRWGVPVAAGKTTPLGTVMLERGASVVGWVVVEGGQIDSSQCTVRLAVLQSSGADLESATTLERTAVQGEVRKDGFFQMTGLAPGTYTLEIQQPGYSAVRVSPVRIDRGAETFLGETLVLRRVLDLELEVHPPLDWIGQPWRARITRLGEQRVSPIVFEGPVDATGRLTIPGQSAGRFGVSIEDSLGNALHYGEEVVDGPASLISIDLQLITVEGRVSLGSEPLEAVLWFGGRHGATSARMESDAEGRFHGVLPKEGMWRLEIEAAQPGFPVWTRADVQAGDSGKASLDVALPDTRVFGRVVDEQGKPVPAADVVALTETADMLVTADAMGSFELRGLQEGPVWLAAESSKKASDRVFTVLAEGRAAGPIELRLRPTRRVTGTVLSARGPVAGAHVMLLARTPDGGGAAATTDTAGRFEADLPRAVTRIAAIISAPGFPLRVFETAVAEEALSFHVSEEGGSLELRLPLDGDELQRENLVLALFQNGIPVPMAVLGRWAFDHGQPRGGVGGAFRVPEVAPGE